MPASSRRSRLSRRSSARRAGSSTTSRARCCRRSSQRRWHSRSGFRRASWPPGSRAAARGSCRSRRPAGRSRNGCAARCWTRRCRGSSSRMRRRIPRSPDWPRSPASWAARISCRSSRLAERSSGSAPRRRSARLPRPRYSRWACARAGRRQRGRPRARQRACARCRTRTGSSGAARRSPAEARRRSARWPGRPPNTAAS